MINLEDIEKIYLILKNTKGGKNADYIPELKKVNPNLYSISIFTVDGYEYDIGDYDTKFAIQSCSKVFTLALALEKFGIPTLKAKIGIHKSYEKFNSINAIENDKTHTINSFDNGGAMATTSLLYETTKTNTEKQIIDNMSQYAGTRLHVNKNIYLSEITNADHNLAIAYLLKSYNRFYADVDKTVDIYTKQCSVMVTTNELAVMAATLANKGLNPKTNKRVIDAKFIPFILEQMVKNGLYEESDNWFKSVGFPAKSGVGGLLMIVIPGLMGIAIASPPLNSHGNSVKGIRTAKLIADLLK